MDYRQIEQEKLLLKKEIQYLKDKKKEKLKASHQQEEPKEDKTTYEPKSELHKIQGILFQSESKSNLVVPDRRAATVRSHSKSSMAEIAITKSQVAVPRLRQPSMNSSFWHYQQEQEKSRITREVSTKSIYIPPTVHRVSYMEKVEQLQEQCRNDYGKAKQRIQRNLVVLLGRR